MSKEIKAGGNMARVMILPYFWLIEICVIV